MPRVQNLYEACKAAFVPGQSPSLEALQRVKDVLGTLSTEPRTGLRARTHALTWALRLPRPVVILHGKPCEPCYQQSATVV